MTQTYEVKGMTCGHCVDAVTKAMSDLPGVSGVTVDLPTGNVAVTSDALPDLASVRAAIEEAGFELVS